MAQASGFAVGQWRTPISELGFSIAAPRPATLPATNFSGLSAPISLANYSECKRREKGKRGKGERRITEFEEPRISTDIPILLFPFSRFPFFLPYTFRNFRWLDYYREKLSREFYGRTPSITSVPSVLSVLSVLSVVLPSVAASPLPFSSRPPQRWISITEVSSSEGLIPDQSTGLFLRFFRSWWSVACVLPDRR